MTRSERKAYKKGKADGYAAGYVQGLHDGNPFIKIADTMSKVAKDISKVIEENPELLISNIDLNSDIEEGDEI